jgi:outer membrane protein assembly factor BamB
MFRTNFQCAICIVAAFLITCSAAEFTLGADIARWPQFRGSNSAGVAEDERQLPIEFGPSKNCLWKTPLPIGHSSPCIWGDRIFLTSFDPAAAKLETICVNRADGSILWRRTAPAEQIERSHELGNPAASTTAVDGDRVYVYFGSYGLLCYDHAGNELWKIPMKTPQTRFGTATSPVLVDGRLVLNYQGAYAVAVDAKSGDEIWKNSKLPYPPDYALPVVRKAGDVTEIIIQGTGGMAAVDLVDGTVRWQVSGFAMMPIGTPVLGEDLLFAVSFHPIGKSEDRIALTWAELLEKYDEDGDKKLGLKELPDKLALVSRGDPEGAGDMTFKQMFGMLDRNNDKKIDALEWTGVEMFTGQINNALMAFRPGDDGKISKQGMVWKAERGLPESPSPLYYRGNLYLVKNGGVLSCFEAATGKQHYQKRLEGAGGSYYASPVAGDGKIYASSMDGIVTVLEASDELKVVAQNNLEERLMATPAIVDGKLYLRTAGHLYAFGQRP